MLFCDQRKSVEFKFKVHDITLPTVTHTKFLGVWLDDKLKWDVHVNKLILKLKRNENLLKRGKNLLSIHAKRLVYYAHLQSHVTYCLSVWGNLICNTTIAKLQKCLLKSCLHVVKSKSMTQMRILTIQNLINLENYKFGYKLVNGLLPTSVQSCVVTDPQGKSLNHSHNYSTRNKGLPNLPKGKPTKYLNSILCQGPKKFAELDCDIRNKLLLG